MPSKCGTVSKHYRGGWVTGIRSRSYGTANSDRVSAPGVANGPVRIADHLGPIPLVASQVSSRKIQSGAACRATISAILRAIQSATPIRRISIPGTPANLVSVHAIDRVLRLLVVGDGCRLEDASGGHVISGKGRISATTAVSEGKDEYILIGCGRTPTRRLPIRIIATAG